MKTIQSIPTWVKGQAVTATIFNLRPIGGELFQSATFYFALLDSDLVVTADGNLTMSGEAYNEWGNDDEYAYNYAANMLNLVITGDYVAPVIDNSEGINKIVAEMADILDIEASAIHEVIEQVANEPTVKESLTVETDTEI
jgi:hypothetical protein